MIWVILALLAAIFTATFYALVKKSIRDVNQYLFASGMYFSAFLLLFVIVIVKGFPKISPDFYHALLMTVLVNVMAATLYYKALKISDISLTVPMTAFTPIFLIFTSTFILGEFPSSIGIVGIILITMGAYVLNLVKGRGIMDPFKEIMRNKGILYMLGVAFLFSFSANYDKMATINSDPVFSSAMIVLCLGVVFLLISYTEKEFKLGVVKKKGQWFFVTGIVFALAILCSNLAFTMQIVPYVLPIKRMSILFTVLFGGLIFKEKNIIKRITGASIMVIGAVVIILFS